MHLSRFSISLWISVWIPKDQGHNVYVRVHAFDASVSTTILPKSNYLPI